MGSQITAKQMTCLVAGDTYYSSITGEKRTYGDSFLMSALSA